MESSEDRNAADVVKIISLDSVDSTNLELARLMSTSLVQPWTVIVAQEQTAGRGRQGRTWSSDHGAGMWASVLVELVDCPTPTWLPLITGMAVARATRELTGSDIGVKWPNDVMADGRKLAGILVESVPGTHQYIVGIGLNFTSSIYPGAVGLRELGPAGKTLGRDLVVNEVTHQLFNAVRAWGAGSWRTEQLERDYTSVCLSIGVELAITEPGGATWAGVGCGIDSEGHLLVREHNSEMLRTLIAADVVHATIAPCTQKNS